MNTEEQILELNRRINKAEENGRAEELAPLLAEHFAVIQSSGAKVSRQEFLDTIAATPLGSRRIEQPEVHFYGNNAVYTCIVNVDRDASGALNPTRYWNMRLFLYQNGQWLCTAWQVTKLCAPRYSQGLFNQAHYSYAAGAE